MSPPVLVRFDASQPAIPGTGVRFVCPFCRRSCDAGISKFGAVVAQHAAPWCLERSSSSAIEFLRAVRSSLGGDGA